MGEVAHVLLLLLLLHFCFLLCAFLAMHASERNYELAVTDGY